jgi:hypothetical protein
MSISEETIARDLADVSRRTGLVVRPLDSAAVSNLFAELENYDPEERAATFDFLKAALNETRASLGAEPAYTDDE